MAGKTCVTVTGNITADPELRITPDGTAVATFTVASNPRVRDYSGEWADGPTLFLRCRVRRIQAENVAESLAKGARVTVTGRLGQRTYRTRDGWTRTVVDVEADDVAVSLRFATATVEKNAQQPAAAVV